MTDNTLSLSEVCTRVGLVYDESDRYFADWLTTAPAISEQERHILNQLRRSYETRLKSNTLRDITMLVLIAPLLKLAGYYDGQVSIHKESLPPSHWTEDGIDYSRRVDVVVVQQHLWVLMVKSTPSRLDVTQTIPFALDYLLTQPDTTAPRFGMVTNGREVLFLKLQPQQPPTYSQSRVYQLVDRLEDLPQILQGLKVIGQQMST